MKSSEFEPQVALRRDDPALQPVMGRPRKPGARLRDQIADPGADIVVACCVI